MNNRVGPTASIPSAPALTSGGNGGNSGSMSPSAAPSPVSSMSGMGSPHTPGIGLKPGTQTPPASVLQVVKQVCVLFNFFNNQIFTVIFVLN